MNLVTKRTIRSAVVAAIAGGLVLTATLAPANAGANDSDSDNPPEQRATELIVASGVPADEVPSATVDWLTAIIDEGAEVGSVASSQYDTQHLIDDPNDVAPMAYETAPCYLTIVTQYNFGSPKWVDNDSLTACTQGYATTTRHDMQLIKRDTVWGTTSVVAEGEVSSRYAGNFSSHVRYGCASNNDSDFKGDTAGEILYNGSYYYAAGDSGDYDNYDCG